MTTDATIIDRRMLSVCATSATLGDNVCQRCFNANVSLYSESFDEAFLLVRLYCRKCKCSGDLVE